MSQMAEADRADDQLPPDEKDSKEGSSKHSRESTEDADERRFNETLRKMLNTPPKPHKDKSATKPEKGSARKGAAAGQRR